MKKYARTGTDEFGFVFPNGSVYFIEPDHSTVAENIVKSIGIDCGGMNQVYYLLSLGVVRIGNMGEFYVEASMPFDSVVENAILDVAAGQNYNMSIVDLNLLYYKQAEFLKRKLERGRL